MHLFPRKVVCAANRITFKDGRVVTLVGVRHWDPIMREQADWIGLKESGRSVIEKEEQGFLDQWRVFMDREEAMLAPFNLERNGGSGLELYSEGVW